MNKKTTIRLFLIPSIFYALWITSWIDNYFLGKISWKDSPEWWAGPFFSTLLGVFIFGVFISFSAIASFVRNDQKND